MAKLVITVPEQHFEFELSDQTYRSFLDDVEAGEDTDSWFDAWLSDVSPDMDWDVVE